MSDPEAAAPSLIRAELQQARDRLKKMRFQRAMINSRIDNEMLNILEIRREIYRVIKG